jgi:hypothetical protein
LGSIGSADSVNESLFAASLFTASAAAAVAALCEPRVLGTSRASATGLFKRIISVSFVPSTAVTLRVSSTTVSAMPVYSGNDNRASALNSSG